MKNKEYNILEIEIEKYKIDKEKVVDVENNKTKNIIHMFERGKLTFEQMEKLLNKL